MTALDRLLAWGGDLLDRITESDYEHVDTDDDDGGEVDLDPAGEESDTDELGEYR